MEVLKYEKQLLDEKVRVIMFIMPCHFRQQGLEINLLPTYHILEIEITQKWSYPSQKWSDFKYVKRFQRKYRPLSP